MPTLNKEEAKAFKEKMISQAKIDLSTSLPLLMRRVC